MRFRTSAHNSNRILRTRLVCVLLLSICHAPWADEATVLDGHIERIVNPSTSLSAIDFRIELAAQALSAQARIERIELPAADLSLTNVSAACARVRLTTLKVHCEDASIAVNLPGIGRVASSGWLSYERGEQITRFELREIRIAGGRLRLRGTASGASAALDYAASALSIADLLAIGRALGAGPLDLTAAGTISGRGSVELIRGGISGLTLDGTLDGASLANDIGTLVAEAVHGDVDLAAVHRAGQWRIDADLHLNAGEAYIEPVYADLAKNAVTLSVADVRTADFRTFIVPRLALRQAGQLEIRGDLRLELPAAADGALAASGTIELIDTSVNAIYAGLLRVMLAGTLLGELETSGRVSGTVDLERNTPVSARLNLDDVIVDDRMRRFALYGVQGRIDWPGAAAGADASPSRLTWGAASVYSILIGGGRAEFLLGDDDFELLEPLRLPMLGGAVRINRLSIDDYGSPTAGALLDADLEPIQLGQLTASFGWPAFSGSLSGRLPLLQYEGNAMTVGGNLTARAFDGDIAVSNLRIEQPFGRVPRLYGDLRLRGLELERITNTFSFGYISGRLHGDVTGLEMIGWRPVAMDLNLYTPPGDKSRHRISQRAVENLASIGGGSAGGALSSGILRIFDVFAYDRIGLRCVLRDGVCSMSGVGPARAGTAGQGYYIVKGSGLPRIDVIGYQQRVSWPRLTRQLANITRRRPIVQQ